ncbi:hypothetical protein [Actinomadura rudentiformis]|uniref:Uncharacterized protein n=1 Tax=Actinomadura rudentiformis TaxID=359158 RepID=A0A6H9Z9B7_9ACTN|nr:hypothetical protein [Actinomadura rudentiformis]KAB2350704.1 hypothetical protein F8566_06870 [Actinomadura rudentiformis]
MTDDSRSPAALLLAEAIRWVDRSGYPDVVEVVFEDADGRQHSIIDKTPLFWDADDEPDPDAELPVPVYLDVVLLERDLPGGRVRVAIDHRSVNDEGYAEFIVPADLISQVGGTGSSEQ